MSPADFEAQHRADWECLTQALDRPLAGPDAAGQAWAQVQTYRRVCEHLALAQARQYPPGLVQRLEALCTRAHQRLYGKPPRWQAHAWSDWLRWRVPSALQARRLALGVATLAFFGPMLGMLLAVWLDPGRALWVLDAYQIEQFEAMYAPSSESLGRPRGAEDDWEMLGFYVMNNIGIGFQCYASGVLFGVGSLFYLVWNGLMLGTVAGYLSQTGSGDAFWRFVVCHAPFELSAIVVSGAAGLHLGRAVLAPGRQTRSQALVQAGRDTTPLLGAMVLLLLGAAVLEAFWSSAKWLDWPQRLLSAGLCLAGVWTWLRPLGPA